MPTGLCYDCHRISGGWFIQRRVHAFRPVSLDAGDHSQVERRRVLAAALLKPVLTEDMDLQISIRESGDVTILDLRGRATIGADSDLLIGHLQSLVAKSVRKLLVNLADVTQLDSSGISAITSASVSLRRHGGSLKLLCPSGRVQAVLRVIHLPDIIPTFEDETQALASFRPQRHSARP